jgi:propanol-preferring alcohol dehydrogenase
MTAAFMTAPGKPLEFADTAVPQPGPGELLVRIEVCGLCHTDLHYWKGDHPLPRDLPIVLGHEGVGRVVKTGAGVSRIETGAKVGVGFVHGTCGHCRECMSGHETHCGEVASTGVHVDGCFADYAVIREDWATHIPDELDSANAAPLLCAGVAAYSAVRKAKLEPGELVAIFGTGGLGSYAIQLAKLSGARVAAVDVSEEKLAHAQMLGADYGISALGDPGAEIQALGGADACFNFAPVASSWRQILAASRTRARIVLISLPTEPLSFEAGEIIESGLRVMGSADGTRLELRQLMELARNGKIESVVEPVPFKNINSAIERLAGGKVQGRLVIDMR